MNKPHISNPLDEARRRANDANHHIYRAMYQDTAYELSQAVKDLKRALKIVEEVQRDYPLADPAKIDTNIPAWDPRLAPPGSRGGRDWMDDLPTRQTPDEIEADRASVQAEKVADRAKWEADLPRQEADLAIRRAEQDAIDDTVDPEDES